MVMFGTHNKQHFMVTLEKVAPQGKIFQIQVEKCCTIQGGEQGEEQGDVKNNLAKSLTSRIILFQNLPGYIRYEESSDFFRNGNQPPIRTTPP